MNAYMFLIGVICLALYFIPSVLAANLGCKHTAGIVVLNFLLGWCFLGWVGALIWAVSDTRNPV